MAVAAGGGENGSMKIGRHTESAFQPRWRPLARTVPALMLALLLASSAQAEQADWFAGEQELHALWPVPELACSLSPLQRSLQAGGEETGDAAWTYRTPGDRIWLARLGSDARFAIATTGRDWARFHSLPARMSWDDAFIATTLIAVGGVIYAYDDVLLEAVQRNSNHALVGPFRRLGEATEKVGTKAFTEKYLLGGLALGYLTGWAPVRDISADILESQALALIAQGVTKYGVARTRPFQGGKNGRDFPGGDSFVSGHTANVVQMARILSHHLPAWPVRTAVWTVAGSVMLQRMTDDAHWPSDIYFGALLGWLVAEEMLGYKQQRRVQVRPLLFPHRGGLFGGARLGLRLY